jgi:hypothetical protein
MSFESIAAIIISVWTMSTPPGESSEPTSDKMPPQLQRQFALSALSLTFRGRASGYLRDPGKCDRLSYKGASGVTCLPQRTAWEMSDFRNDIYIPLCNRETYSRAHFVEGSNERKIIADQRPFLPELCAYRGVLCLQESHRALGSRGSE